MSKYKLSDIKVNSLVTFKKHNGRGRPITYRSVFINYVDKDFIAYDTFRGWSSEIIDLKEVEIVNIKYFNCDIKDGKLIMDLIKEE